MEIVATVIAVIAIMIIAIVVLAVNQYKLNARVNDLDKTLVQYVSKILEPRIQSIADTHDRFVDYVNENVVFKKSTEEKVEKKKGKRGRPKKAKSK